MRLHCGGDAKGGASGGLLLKGLDHQRMGVAHDEAGGVYHEIKVRVVVSVVDVMPFASIGKDGIGVKVGRTPGAPARKVMGRFGI